MATNTATTSVTHTGNGSTNAFAIPFSFLADSEVDVTVAGVLKTINTHYTINGSTVTFTSGNTPANGAAVKFQRDTDISAKKVDFSDGSVLTEADLDANSDQIIFAQQEITDKLGGIEEGATADQTNAEIKTAYEANSDTNAFTDADHNKLDGIEAGATGDQTNAEIRAAVEAASDSNVFTDNDHTKLNNIEDNATADQTVSEIKSLIASSPLDASHLAANSVDTSELADDSVTNAKLADAELKTLAGMQSGTASKLADSTALTSDIADLNQLDGLQKATTITDDDTKFPTSGAIVDYVAAQLAPIGGLEAIANENSFPNTQPQSGVVISIADAGGMAVSSTGTASGQTVGGTTVNISGIATNFRGSSVAAGVRFLVVSTGAGQNYTYHKATLKEDDLVGLSGDINDFGERYRVGSSNPTTNNDSGDLFFNTGTGKLLVYNGTSGAWEEAQSVGNFFISTLSPAFDGSTQNFTITNAPTSAQQVLLIIEGVLQKPNSGTSTPTEGFALDGNTVKLAAAPAVGASYHAVVMGSTVNIGTPSDNTVTTNILQNNSVSSGKIQADAVDGSKIADDSINSEHYVDASIDHAHLSNDCVDGDNIADDSINSEHYVDGSIDTAHIADDAVDASKLANSINSAIAANTAKDLTALSASNLTSGTVPDARFPATLPAVSGANLTNLPASGKAHNHIYNGAMQVNQRGVAFTNVGSSATTYLPLDRWRLYVQNTSARFQVEKNYDHSLPDGFKNSMRISCTTADTSLAATDEVQLIQSLEGQDLTAFAKGTSSAKQYTLSFYARSTKTGTYVVSLLGRNNTTSTVSKSYTMSNTWTRHVLTFPADTNGNRKDNDDNGEALRIVWWLVAGSGVNNGTLQETWVNSTDTGRATGQVNFADSTNEFYITGVQLEVGDTVSDFAYEDYGTSLAKCQRYFEIAEGGFHGAVGSTDSNVKVIVSFKVTKRASPTLATISTDENCCSSVSVEANSQDPTLGARVVGNNVFLDGANRFFVAKFSASAEL